MTTCPSCGIAGNNFNCPNHIYWGINPLPDSIPMPEQSAWSSLYAEIGRLNVLLNERDKEIAALKQTSADLCSECGWRFLVPGIGCQGCERARLEQEVERLKGLMPPDERGPGFVGQGSWSVFAEKVVAERDAALEKVAELTECLRWYVENDDTHDVGVRITDQVAHWFEGKRRAMRALGLEEE